MSFRSPELASLVHNPTLGTCMSSVSDGWQTQPLMMTLSEDGGAGQYQIRLTSTLRCMGMQLHQQADGISLSTAEKQWPHAERTLSARTDGDKSAFVPLETFAEPSEADRLVRNLQQDGVGTFQALESTNQQRVQMAVQQERA